MASTSKSRRKQGRRESDIWIHYHEIDEHHVKCKYCIQKSVTRNATRCKLHSLKCRPRKINQNQQLIQINVEDNDIQVIDQANGMVIVSEPSNDEVVVTEQVHLSAHTTHQPNTGHFI